MSIDINILDIIKDNDTNLFLDINFNKNDNNYKENFIKLIAYINKYSNSKKNNDSKKNNVNLNLSGQNRVDDLAFIKKSIKYLNNEEEEKIDPKKIKTVGKKFNSIYVPSFRAGYCCGNTDLYTFDEDNTKIVENGKTLNHIEVFNKQMPAEYYKIVLLPFICEENWIDSANFFTSSGSKNASFAQLFSKLFIYMYNIDKPISDDDKLLKQLINERIFILSFGGDSDILLKFLEKFGTGYAYEKNMNALLINPLYEAMIKENNTRKIFTMNMADDKKIKESIRQVQYSLISGFDFDIEPNENKEQI